MAQAFDGVVVEVDLGNDRTALFEGLRVRREAVVLRGDGDFAGFEIFDGLVAAAVAELELESGSAEGVRQHLVAEADAEDWVVRDEAGDGLVDVGQGGGIAGAVGEEHAVGVVGLDLLGGGGGGENLHVEAVVDKLAEDAVLRAEIKGGDCETFGRRVGQAEGGADGDVDGVVVGGVGRAPDVGGLASGVLDVVTAGHVVPGLGLGDGVGIGERERGEAALEGAFDAEFFGERAGVDFADAGDAVFGEVGVEGGLAAPVADDGGEFADDEAAGLGRGGLGVLVVDAVVADHRRGHGDDLAEVGGIGDDFLVAGHRRVENALARNGGGGAKSAAVKHRTIFEGEDCGLERGH